MRGIYRAMPEALAVLVVFVVAVLAWIGAWVRARDPASYNAHEETQRLRHHVVWLQQRIELAEKEKWGQEMLDSLADELEATAFSLRQQRGASRDLS